MKYERHSPGEKRAIVAQIRRLRKDDINLKEACDRLELPVSTYYLWLRKGVGSRSDSKKR